MAAFCTSKKSFFSPLLNQPLPLVTPLPDALASTIHYASTFRRASLIWLVVALPSASTPILLQRRLVALASASCCFLACSLLQCSVLSAICHLCLALGPSQLVGCRISQHISLSRCAPLVRLVVAYPRASAPSSQCASPFPLLSRSPSVASVGPPLLLLSLHASVASAGSPLPMPLLCVPVARVWPRGGSEFEWIMFLIPAKARVSVINLDSLICSGTPWAPDSV